MPDPIRILLIEDDPGHARLVQELLKDAGGLNYAIEWASRLSDGLLKGAASGVDAVLLDLSLPDSFGVESFRRVSEGLPGVPVVILSSNDDGQIADELKRAGASDYLVKGQFDSAALGSAVRAALKTRPQRSQKSAGA